MNSNQATETRRVQRDEVRRNISELAQSLELRVTFTDGKRQGDIKAIS